jgi:hypothetical protein
LSGANTPTMRADAFAQIDDYAPNDRVFAAGVEAARAFKRRRGETYSFDWRAGRFAREKTPKIGPAAGAASRMGGSARLSGRPRASVIPANDHLPLDAWQGSDSASCRGARGKLSAAAQIDERTCRS